MHNIFRLFVVLFNNFTFLICLQFVHFLVMFHNAVSPVLQTIHKFLLSLASPIPEGVFSPVFFALCFLIVKALFLIFLFCEFSHVQCPLFPLSFHFCVILPSSSRQTPDKKKPCRIHRQGFFLIINIGLFQIVLFPVKGEELHQFPAAFGSAAGASGAHHGHQEKQIQGHSCGQGETIGGKHRH